MAEVVYMREFVQHVPGHKNSKGQAAPWVVKSHTDQHIISSHATEEAAREHLQQMEAHKHMAEAGVVYAGSAVPAGAPTYSQPPKSAILQAVEAQKQGIYQESIMNTRPFVGQAMEVVYESITFLKPESFAGILTETRDGRLLVVGEHKQILFEDITSYEILGRDLREEAETEIVKLLGMIDPDKIEDDDDIKAIFDGALEASGVENPQDQEVVTTLATKLLGEALDRADARLQETVRAFNEGKENREDLQRLRDMFGGSEWTAALAYEISDGEAGFDDLEHEPLSPGDEGIIRKMVDYLNTIQLDDGRKLRKQESSEARIRTVLDRIAKDHRHPIAGRVTDADVYEIQCAMGNGKDLAPACKEYLGVEGDGDPTNE